MLGAGKRAVPYLGKALIQLPFFCCRLIKLQGGHCLDHLHLSFWQKHAQGVGSTVAMPMVRSVHKVQAVAVDLDAVMVVPRFSVPRFRI